MKIRLERIASRDARRTADLCPGEVVEHEVELSIDGQRRCFTVYLKAHAVAGTDSSLVHGDELLEALLRFEPAALAALYAAVARHRRGSPARLPLLLVGADGPNAGALPAAAAL